MFGSVVLPGAGIEPIDVVVVRIENHGRTKSFLDGGVCFTEAGKSTRGWFGANALGEPLFPGELDAGNAVSIPIRATDLLEFRDRIDRFFVTDKLGNEYFVSAEETRTAIERALDEE
jgi:hypothetical protein